MELCLDMSVEILTIDGFRASGAVVGVRHSLYSRCDFFYSHKMRTCQFENPTDRLGEAFHRMPGTGGSHQCSTQDQPEDCRGTSCPLRL